MRQLLVLAKEPRPGFAKTRLAASTGPEFAGALYRAFLADTAALLRGRPGVRWWVDGDPEPLLALIGTGWEVRRQGPGNLGLRLEHAFAEAFGRGPGPVAVIGADCPLLSPGDLDALFEAVEERADAALVPADDGGYVALALRGLYPEVFQGIPWSTPRVLDATLASLRGAGRTAEVLPARYDVDEEGDLVRLAADLRKTPWAAPATARALGVAP